MRSSRRCLTQDRVGLPWIGQEWNECGTYLPTVTFPWCWHRTGTASVENPLHLPLTALVRGAWLRTQVTKRQGRGQPGGGSHGRHPRPAQQVRESENGRAQ